MLYFEQTSTNLPIYEIKASDLKDYHTVKADLKKGISKRPHEDYRLPDSASSAETFAGYGENAEEF